LEEVGTGYTFTWSGRPKAERRDAGVAFATRNDIVGRLPFLPQGIKARLSSLRLHLGGDKFATIISAFDLPYPPMTSSLRQRKKSTRIYTPSSRLAQPDPNQYPFLPSAAAECDLGAPSVETLAHAGLCPRSRARSTGRAGHKGHPGADGWPDHRLVISKIRLHLQPRRKPEVINTRFDENDAAIKTLLTEKNRLRKAYVNRPTAANKTVFYRSHRLVQQRLREMQDGWVARKVEDIQGYTHSK
uniref:Enkurin domain-containing protein n=1 Tax=Schistocephalus solidus TaxID=70667 RepID=A0A183SIT2_SCHSO